MGRISHHNFMHFTKSSKKILLSFWSKVEPCWPMYRCIAWPARLCDALLHLHLRFHQHFQMTLFHLGRQWDAASFYRLVVCLLWHMLRNNAARDYISDMILKQHVNSSLE